MDSRVANSCPFKCKSASKPRNLAAAALFRSIYNRQSVTFLPPAERTTHIVQNVNDDHDTHTRVQLAQQFLLHSFPLLSPAKLGVDIPQRVVRRNLRHSTVLDIRLLSIMLEIVSRASHRGVRGGFETQRRGTRGGGGGGGWEWWGMRARVSTQKTFDRGALHEARDLFSGIFRATPDYFE